jgi:hypothetical protein
MYWIYHVLGWSEYAAVGITINLLNRGEFRPLILSQLLSVSYSIGLTHLSRHEIRNGGHFIGQWPGCGVLWRRESY